MKIEIALIISIVGVLIALLSYITNKKKTTSEEVKSAKQEEKENSTIMATINVKLDSIATNVSEIRLDNREISKNMKALSDRVLVLETTSKNHEKEIKEIKEKRE